MRGTIGLAWLAAGLCLAGGLAPARADPGVDAGRIVFGQAAALEGPAAALGTGMRDGLKGRLRGGQQGRRRQWPQAGADLRR